MHIYAKVLAIVLILHNGDIGAKFVEDHDEMSLLQVRQTFGGRIQREGTGHNAMTRPCPNDCGYEEEKISGPMAREMSGGVDQAIAEQNHLTHEILRGHIGNGKAKAKQLLPSQPTVPSTAPSGLSPLPEQSVDAQSQSTPSPCGDNVAADEHPLPGAPIRAGLVRGMEGNSQWSEHPHPYLPEESDANSYPEPSAAVLRGPLSKNVSTMRVATGQRISSPEDSAPRSNSAMQPALNKSSTETKIPMKKVTTSHVPSFADITTAPFNPNEWTTTAEPGSQAEWDPGFGLLDYQAVLVAFNGTDTNPVITYDSDATEQTMHQHVRGHESSRQAETTIQKQPSTSRWSLLGDHPAGVDPYTDSRGWETTIKWHEVVNVPLWKSTTTTVEPDADDTTAPEDHLWTSSGFPYRPWKAPEIATTEIEGFNMTTAGPDGKSPTTEDPSRDLKELDVLERTTTTPLPKEPQERAQAEIAELDHGTEWQPPQQS